MPLQILFFGSFQKYSVQVLNKLVKNFQVVGVVTIPPHPSGRHLTLTPTEVAIYSKKQKLPLFEFENLDKLPSISPPDFIVVAGYGKLIPPSWLAFPKVMSVNLHQSLLPKYAGRFPAEWAILNGETQTGNTLIKMSPQFDTGEILFQETVPITPDDTRETLYTKLYDLGGDLLVNYLPQIAAGKISPHPQPQGDNFYAKQLTRDDGFIPWFDFKIFLQHLQSERARKYDVLNEVEGQRDPTVEGSSRTSGTGRISWRDCKCEEIGRKFRALQGWPGVWTTTPNNKRLKLISLTPQILVQEEGKTTKPWQLSEFS